MYSFGLIGNCHTSALVKETGSLEWLCLPRPDSEPVFANLLDSDGGCFSISLRGQKKPCKQYYLDNTNVLITEISSDAGDKIRIIDFCPRYYLNGRIQSPALIHRIVEPVKGNPRLRVSCSPINGWQKQGLTSTRNNGQICFAVGDGIIYLSGSGDIFAESTGQVEVDLRKRICFSLSYDVHLPADPLSRAESELNLTTAYWQTWVKHCTIPTLFQKETIRSALILKLHCYEETGAILAALTTSLPERPGGERNWDYRFCWLRDAYFVLTSFYSLGHFEEVEGFLKFLLKIAHQHEFSHERLAPVYTLDGHLPLPEQTHEGWSGFEGAKPVRSFNQAAEHIQNDVYGEMILTLAPIFLDERFISLRTGEHENLLAHLAELAASKIGAADAGLWEIREGWREHSFSNLLVWAGLERIQKIQNAGYLKNLGMDLVTQKTRAMERLRQSIVNGSLRNGPEDPTFDASLSMLATLRFPDQELCRRTVKDIQRQLVVKGHEAFFYRYVRQDDFGHPQSAFVVCSFWVVQALALLGEKTEAKKILDEVLSSANSLGLYAEHFDPRLKCQHGNFPQAYSHVGLINSAFAVSPPWNEIL